jgi:predicted acyltransferase
MKTAPDDSARLLSLDAFRGFTVAAMLLVNDPGDWSHIHPPLEHAEWNGCTFTDLIFPAFLCICGVAVALSRGRRAQAGAACGGLLKHTALRALLIVLIGVLLNAVFQWQWQQLRLPGVLQRIGLCTLLAAPLVLHAPRRAQQAAIVALLLVYTALQTWVPVPDVNGAWHTGSWRPGEDTGAWLDRLLMGGHLWSLSRTWDPEGLLSTLPALAVMLGGVQLGHVLRARPAPRRLLAGMALAGAACMAGGLLLGQVSMPVNKNLWTPAFSLLASGWSLWGFALFFAALDAAPAAALTRRLRRLAWPLQAFGMNALFLFVLSGVVGRALVHFHAAGADGAPLSWKAALYAPLQRLPLAPENTSLLFALAFVAVMFMVAALMWRRRWFVKL